MKTLTSLIFSLLLISITAEKAVASETLLQEGKVWNYVLHHYRWKALLQSLHHRLL